jgi:hypothetical protein
VGLRDKIYVVSGILTQKIQNVGADLCVRPKSSNCVRVELVELSEIPIYRDLHPKIYRDRINGSCNLQVTPKWARPDRTIKALTKVRAFLPSIDIKGLQTAGWRSTPEKIIYFVYNVYDIIIIITIHIPGLKWSRRITSF